MMIHARGNEKFFVADALQFLNAKRRFRFFTKRLNKNLKCENHFANVGKMERSRAREVDKR